MFLIFFYSILQFLCETRHWDFNLCLSSNAHLWLFILWTAFFGLHFEWGFLFSSSIFYGFLRKQIGKAKQKNNKLVISIMFKRKIFLNYRIFFVIWQELWYIYVLNVPCIKNNFQKFVISYENEFRGQPDLKIGDGKSCQKTPKIAKRLTVLGLSDLFSMKTISYTD